MKKTIFLLLITAILASSCFRKQGCTSENAFNFDFTAKEDNGLCEFAADAFAGKYAGSESVFHVDTSGITSITRSDSSFIIFWADTNRVQIRGFYDCFEEKDSINCIVKKYDVLLANDNSNNLCIDDWRSFYMTREGDSVVTYQYIKRYSDIERDSIIGRASKQ